MRLIDADKFKEDLMKLWDYSCVDGITATTVLKQTIHDLDNAPTIIWCNKTSDGYPLMDLRPKEKGEWIGHIQYCKQHNLIPTGYELFVWCNRCNCPNEKKTKFCPNCGAEMRKGGTE
ncbi:MAG: hypothetical protein J6Y02_21490 [Pseudobutyrivibrio sp.]|nr:hypothetical protein [Pseudobutyrivibrio sp.]